MLKSIKKQKESQVWAEQNNAQKYKPCPIYVRYQNYIPTNSLKFKAKF